MVEVVGRKAGAGVPSCGGCFFLRFGGIDFQDTFLELKGHGYAGSENLFGTTLWHFLERPELSYEYIQDLRFWIIGYYFVYVINGGGLFVLFDAANIFVQLLQLVPLQ